jgi:hypothetical protein
MLETVISGIESRDVILIFLGLATLISLYAVRKKEK